MPTETIRDEMLSAASQMIDVAIDLADDDPICIALLDLANAMIERCCPES